MSKVSGATLIVRALRAEGVDRIYVLLGDHVLPVGDAAYEAGIRLIHTRHESAAIAMADAQARATGRPGVVFVTGGPGHANSLAGLTIANAGEMPLVHISGRLPFDTEGMIANQEIDQVALATPATKAAWAVRDVKRLPREIAAAFRIATSGRPGPVHLTIPLDLQDALLEEEDVPAGRLDDGLRGLPMPDPHAVGRATELLRAAERPVMIAGFGAWTGVDPAKLTAVLEQAQVPLFTAEAARGLVSDEHPLCFGYPDLAFNSGARLIRQADLIFLLGKKIDYRLGYGQPPVVARDTKIIHADRDPAALGKNRAVDLAIAGDPGRLVEQLAAADLAPRRDRSAWLGELRAARAAHWAEVDRLAEDADAPLHPARILREVDRQLDDRSFVVFDSGDFVMWGRGVLKARRPGGYLRPGPLGHLGTGLPYALSCRLVDPDAKVVLITGDGGLGFYLMELETAVRHNLPIVVVVGNDAAWGLEKHFQLAYYGRIVETDLRPVRYDRLIGELGGYGERVERAEDLPGALERAFASGRPAVVDIAMRTLPSPLAREVIQRRQAALRR